MDWKKFLTPTSHTFYFFPDLKHILLFMHPAIFYFFSRPIRDQHNSPVFYFFTNAPPHILFIFANAPQTFLLLVSSLPPLRISNGIALMLIESKSIHVFYGSIAFHILKGHVQKWGISPSSNPDVTNSEHHPDHNHDNMRGT